MSRSDRYCVMLSDLRRGKDAYVESRINRRSARRVVSEKNAMILQRFGGKVLADDGLPVPLYYCVRQKGRKEIS